MPEATGPLASVGNEDDIAAAFRADPFSELSDDKIDAAVIELRRRRNAFLSTEAAKSLNKKDKKPKPEPVSSEAAAKMDKPAAETSIEDLFGDE